MMMNHGAEGQIEIVAFCRSEAQQQSPATASANNKEDIGVWFGGNDGSHIVGWCKTMLRNVGNARYIPCFTSHALHPIHFV